MWRKDVFILHLKKCRVWHDHRRVPLMLMNYDSLNLLQNSIRPLNPQVSWVNYWMSTSLLSVFQIISSCHLPYIPKKIRTMKGTSKSGTCMVVTVWAMELLPDNPSLVSRISSSSIWIRSTRWSYSSICSSNSSFYFLSFHSSDGPSWELWILLHLMLSMESSFP